MIVDTSAIIAILRDEDDAAAYADALANADVRRLSAASYLECGIVLDSQRDPVISRALDELIEEAEFVVEPVTERQARLARAAYADFGRGSGHPAGLNFGDCLSYALAIDRREPLLWKGNDFGTPASKGHWIGGDRRQPGAAVRGSRVRLFSFRRSGGSGGLCGVRCVELWAWTWERHGFRAFAETAAPQLIWREYRPGWTRYGDGSVAQVKSIFDAPRGYLNAACRRRVVHWASGLLRRIL